jgi:uncharacterized protein (TIGR00730 family)
VTREPSRPAVCVFCSSSTVADPRYAAVAAEVGRALGERGWTLVSGGGSVGSMGAVAVAARASGAWTVGVIPQALHEREVADLDADELVVVATMRERKALMDERSDAFLALPGGLGTLEELLEVWTAGSLELHTKPVVVLDPAGDLTPLRTLVDHLAAARLVSERARSVVRWAASVDEALDAVEAAYRPAREQRPPAPHDEELLEYEP